MHKSKTKWKTYRMREAWNMGRVSTGEEGSGWVMIVQMK